MSDKKLKTLNEALGDYLVNDDYDKAKELTRQYILERAASILRDLEENCDIEDLERDEHEDFVDEIEAEIMFDDVDLDIDDDEEFQFEEDEVELDLDVEDAEADLMLDLSDLEDEDNEELAATVDDLEDRVADVEINMDELEAEFDALLADDSDEVEVEDEVSIDDDLEESVKLEKVKVPTEKATSSKSPVAKNKKNGLDLGGEPVVIKDKDNGKAISTKAGSLAKEGNTFKKSSNILKPVKK